MRKQNLKRPVGFWEDERSLEAIVVDCEGFQLGVVLKSGQRTTKAVGVKENGLQLGWQDWNAATQSIHCQ